MPLKLSKCSNCKMNVYWITDEDGRPRMVNTKKKTVVYIGTADVVRTVSGYPLHQTTCAMRPNETPQTEQEAEQQVEPQPLADPQDK